MYNCRRYPTQESVSCRLWRGDGNDQLSGGRFRLGRFFQAE